MKRILFILICGLLARSACQKRGMNLFRGDYSFKTSGSVTLDEIVPIGQTGEPASYTVSLPNEIGQLEISVLGNETGADTFPPAYQTRLFLPAISSLSPMGRMRR